METTTAAPATSSDAFLIVDKSYSVSWLLRCHVGKEIAGTPRKLRIVCDAGAGGGGASAVNVKSSIKVFEELCEVRGL